MSRFRTRADDGRLYILPGAIIRDSNGKFARMYSDEQYELVAQLLDDGELRIADIARIAEMSYDAVWKFANGYTGYTTEQYLKYIDAPEEDE